MIPENLKYTKEHEWIKIEDNIALLGITDYAQSELGDITFVELPKEGKIVNKSDSVAVVESVKAASDIYTPVSGKIIAVNDSLNASPDVINSSPYDNGWICKIEIKDSKDTEDLLDNASYEAYLKENA